MRDVRKALLLLTGAAVLFVGQVVSVPAQASEKAKPQAIKVLRVGSSSFGYDLIEITRAIVEHSGDYRLVCDEQKDKAGYTRLDRFVTRPGLYEEWCEEVMPKVEAGRYDYVIVQTIGWLKFTPEQQNQLCTEIIPDMAERIRATGARVILYDKYLRPLRDQKDPRARTWCQRYPEAYRLNYLLHILAAKRAGIEKISFGGKAVTELWDVPRFARLPFLLHDGHPGPFAHYVSAVNLAYLLTGEDPVGSPVREIPLGEHRWRAFNRLAHSDKPKERRLYEDNKHRIEEDHIILTDEEARILQETAMKSQRKWGGLLRENLESDEAFAETMREMKRIQGDMDKFAEYGLDEATVDRLKAQYAPPEEPGALRPALIKKIRRKSKSFSYADATLRNHANRLLRRQEVKQVHREFERYWDENNSKLRDDVYLEGRLLEARLVKAGKREELQRVRRTLAMIRYVLSLPGWRILLEHLDEEQAKAVLASYEVHGPTMRNSRAFAAYQNENHMDREKLFRAWQIYLDIFSDADRLDRLRDGGYPIEVFHEADREFERRLAAGVESRR
ncbi:MAG: hypothetical protein R6X33_00780 [Candidatus Brocadiia bacterium]